MRATLLAACITAALGKRAGNTLLPRKGDAKITSLVQFTDPPKEASDSTAYKTKLSGTVDCPANPSATHKCHKWSMSQLRSLFTQGIPADSLSFVGLLVHGFDGTLQGGGNNAGSLTSQNATELKEGVQRALPWAPCNSGWCKNSARWLSTSVINGDHHAGFSDGGIILKPSANKVLCSHYYDFGSLEGGCDSAVTRDGAGDTRDRPFPSDALKEMLDRSITYKEAYNEVLVDSAEYESNLPHSVSAFYYGLLKSGGNWSRLHTTAMYVAFLDHYHFNETQVPLVEFTLENPDKHLMTDMSAHARDFLREHPYGFALNKWREENPDLSKHPWKIHEELRKQAETRRKGSSVWRAAKKLVSAARRDARIQATTELHKTKRALREAADKELQVAAAFKSALVRQKAMKARQKVEHKHVGHKAREPGHKHGHDGRLRHKRSAAEGDE